MSAARDFSLHGEEFSREGVFLIKALFSEAEMRLLDQCRDYKLAHPGAGSEQIYPNVRYTLGNSLAEPVFEKLIRDSAMADLVQALFGGGEVWYENDQLWHKDGGARGTRRTAWHQDAAYDPFTGSRTVTFWVPLNSRPAENVLEVVRRSHHGPIYNGTRFDPLDDTAPTFEDPELPRFPDIQANRGGWDILSTPMQRGDALILHHRSIHGGAPVPPGQLWSSMTFRFIGDDVVFKPGRKRVTAGSVEFREQRLSPGMQGLEPGEPIHHSPYFRKVRPWTDPNRMSTGEAQ